MNKLDSNVLLLLGGVALAFGSAPLATAAEPEAAPPQTVPEGGRGVDGDNRLDPAPQGGRGMNSAAGAKAGEAKDMVDINTASKTTLQSQLGLSAQDAQALVQYRSANGPITSQAQLAQVDGLSAEAAAKLKGRAAFAQ